MSAPKLGEKADVTLKNVRIVNHPSARLVRIADEHGDTFDMPPQAAITPAGKSSSSGHVSNALRALDAMEAEGYIQPYVAATVRKELGLPPRHWPPQAGDVWAEANPWCPLWFAHVSHYRRYSELVMVPVESEAESGATKTPDELLDSGFDLTLAYRQTRTDETRNKGDND